MKIGVISDTHDQIERIASALKLFRAEGVELLIHCGDIESPDAVLAFAGWTCHFVYGNCDWDRAGLSVAMSRIGATNHDRFGHLEIEGVKLAFLHGDDRVLLRDIEVSGAYAFLFHGHTHLVGERIAGPTRVINPGALQRATTKTVLVLDLPKGETRTLEVITGERA